MKLNKRVMNCCLIIILVMNFRKKTQHFSRNRGGGERSKAVRKFSENSSIFETTGFPYVITQIGSSEENSIEIMPRKPEFGVEMEEMCLRKSTYGYGWWQQMMGRPIRWKDQYHH